MAQQHQLSKFLLGSRFNVFVRRGSFQNFYCKIVVPNIDATVHKTKKALTNLFAHRVRIVGEFACDCFAGLWRNHQSGGRGCWDRRSCGIP
jgi:hypothetical protein